ncbi:hypothetical protein QGN29_14440 [Temperatibacter marinus]|uniref:Flagellar hook-length control protein FliK n=1 Tax=Temperatibacter marinus TaxID=1456591 RepID=A0AA52EDF9_9PROT|nr:hypothetical protein [Temperatibacter marinus]WND02746.1 hypothetical protein QGN29_14440 [Temperatibacter marinus]
MSDLGAPSGPPKVTQVQRQQPSPAEQPNRAHRRDEHPDTPPQQQQEKQPQQDLPRDSSFRDPAVSIDATTAHISKGEVLTPTVHSIDSEGRPIVDTEKAMFALRPDSGLKIGDTLTLKIIEADATLRADLLKQNERKLEPPIRLQMIVISKHNVESENLPTSAYSKEGTHSLSQTALAQLSVKDITLMPEVAQKSIADFLTTIPNSVTTTLHAAAKPDPMVLQTSREDMSALLSLQADVSQTKNTAVLANLAILPKPQSTLSLQVLDLNNNARPSQLVLTMDWQTNNQTSSFQRIGASEKVISQVPLSQSVLNQFGMGHQNKIHPIYEVQTQTSRFLVTLPEPMDLRGQTIALTPFLKQMTVPSVSNFNSLVKSPDLLQGNDITLNKSVLTTSQGDKSLVILPLHTMKLPSAEQTSQNQTVGTATRHGATSINQMSSSVAEDILVSILSKNAATTGLVSSQSLQIQTPSIESSKMVTTKPSPTGQVATYQLQTSMGSLSVDINWQSDGAQLKIAPDAMPQPFKIGQTLTLIRENPVAAENAKMTSPQAETGAVQTSMASMSAQGGEKTSGQAHAVTPLQDFSGWPSLNMLSESFFMEEPLLGEQFAGLTARDGSNLAPALVQTLVAQSLAAKDPAIAAQALTLSSTQTPETAQKSSTFMDQFVKDIMAQSQASLRDGQGTEWRAAVLPSEPRDPSLSLFAFLFQEEPKREDLPDNSDQNEEDGKNRKEFIVEVDFSEFGPLQIRGHLSPDHLNLIVYTHIDLPNDVKETLQDILSSTLRDNQMQGKLSFEIKEHFDPNAKDLFT